MRKHKKNNSLLFRGYTTINSLPFQGKEVTRAFTLVELIVVITILAILGTIAFISFQGYSAFSRDSVRISDMGKMKTGLELFNIDTGRYPDPTNAKAITYSGVTAWTQGIFGEITNTNVKRLDTLPLDPLTNKEYAYSLLNTKQEYEIGGIMEREEIVVNSEKLIVNSVQALEKTAKAKIIGTYNGISLRVNTESKTYILAVPSIITSIDLTQEDNRKLEKIISEKELLSTENKIKKNNPIFWDYFLA